MRSLCNTWSTTTTLSRDLCWEWVSLSISVLVTLTQKWNFQLYWDFMNKISSSTVETCEFPTRELLAPPLHSVCASLCMKENIQTYLCQPIFANAGKLSSFYIFQLGYWTMFFQHGNINEHMFARKKKFNTIFPVYNTHNAWVDNMSIIIS